MTKVWLLRHGQTEANVIGRFAGRTAEALTDAGRAQAREAGRRLLDNEFFRQKLSLFSDFYFKIILIIIFPDKSCETSDFFNLSLHS